MGKKGLENFTATLASLKSFLDMPIQTDRDKAGIIQAFEFTFEQCWKALQQHAASSGVSVGSPKSAFTYALQNNMINAKNERVWLEMLEDRNLTSHTYKKELADQVIKRIRDQYLTAFEGLLRAIYTAPTSAVE